MEELGWDERGFGEARAECIEARVTVVGPEAGGEGFEELVGRCRIAEADGRSAARREGQDGGDDESGRGAERHARNLDGRRAARKAPTVTRCSSEPARRVAGGGA